MFTQGGASTRARVTLRHIQRDGDQNPANDFPQRRPLAQENVMASRI